MKVLPLRTSFSFIQVFERLFLKSNYLNGHILQQWLKVHLVFNKQQYFLSFQPRKQKSLKELKKNLNWECQKVRKWASPPFLKMTSNGYLLAGKKFGQRAIRILHQTTETSNCNLLPKWITLLFPHTIHLSSGNQDTIWKCR